MKTIAILLLLPALLLADEASKTAKVEELMRISNTEQNMKAMVEQMKTMQLAQLRSNASIPAQDKAVAEEIQTRILDLVADRLTFEKLKPTLIKAYLDLFTESEIDGMLEFFRSPAGKAMLQKTPQLSARLMNVTAQQVGDLSAETKKIIDEVKAKHQGNK